MPLHVLIIPDKFKGTLTAAAAATAIARGCARRRSGRLMEEVGGGQGLSRPRGEDPLGSWKGS